MQRSAWHATLLFACVLVAHVCAQGLVTATAAPDAAEAVRQPYRQFEASFASDQSSPERATLRARRSGDGKLPAGVYVGAVLGGAVAVVLLFLLCWYLQKRRVSRKRISQHHGYAAAYTAASNTGEHPSLAANAILSGRLVVEPPLDESAAATPPPPHKTFTILHNLPSLVTLRSLFADIEQQMDALAIEEAWERMLRATAPAAAADDGERNESRVAADDDDQNDDDDDGDDAGTRTLDLRHLVADRVENAPRNRDANYVPYDFNRVMLMDPVAAAAAAARATAPPAEEFASAPETETGSALLTSLAESQAAALAAADQAERAYINASHIDGAPGCGSYIVTQGPVEETVNDFWEMVWAQQIQCVVMLTRIVEDGVDLCFKYWSDARKTVFASLEVLKVGQKKYHDFVVRNFVLRDTRTRKTRTLTHFHYTGLARNELGSAVSEAQELSLRSLLFRVRHSATTSAPLLVHCDVAGRRTGLFLLLDSLVQQVNAGADHVSPSDELVRLSRQRKGLFECRDDYAVVLCAFVEELRQVKERLVGPTD